MLKNTEKYQNQKEKNWNLSKLKQGTKKRDSHGFSFRYASAFARDAHRVLSNPVLPVLKGNSDAEYRPVG